MEVLAGADNCDLLVDPISITASEHHRLLELVPVETAAGRDYISTETCLGRNDSVLATRHQEVVEEIYCNDQLNGRLKLAFEVVGKHEKAEEEFFKNDNRLDKYQSTRKWGEAIVEIADILTSEVGAESAAYLQALKVSFCDYKETRLSALVKGPIYYTPGGIRGRDEISRLHPRLAFRPGFSGRLILPDIGAGVLAHVGGLPLVVVPEVIMLGIVAGYFTMPSPNGMRMKDSMWSKPTVYKKLRKLARSNPEFEGVKSSTAILDTLRAFAEMKQTYEHNGHVTVFPDLEDSESYHFEATDLKNPLLALKAGRAVVGNSISLGGNDSRLTFLTGPNSGGKSTLSKAVIQNQLLAQLGSPVVASSARISMADRIAYHAPMPPDLEDETGRFGHELGRVREILNNVSEKSLAILDDCLDGTTHEERVSVLRNVMEGFRYLCGSTLFSTHAHELVDQFVGQPDSKFLQVEFAEEHPTYHLLNGISHTSHADKVASIHGFTEEQVAEEIARRQNQQVELVIKNP